MSAQKMALKTLVISIAVAMATSVLADTKQLPRIDVIGQGDDAVTKQPGAVSIVTEENIQRAQPRSTEDVLRRVPGVHVKGEEETAVVVNVGIRGLPASDYKTLVLEDGVPIQPGIFVGNSRYYNPRIQRVERVEVHKGATHRYGPNTIGGVINYITKTPEDGFAISGKVGSWNTREGTLEIGGSNYSGDSFFGLIYTKADSDGFQSKGYAMEDLMIKSGTAIGDDQLISVKFSQYSNDAKISYRGLFPNAYKARATFNPAPDDYFLTERTAFDINHEWDISNDMKLQTLVYWSEMNRDYWRFRLGNQDGFGQQATTTNSAGQRIWNYNDTVQGNNRSFERKGFDTRLSFNHDSLGIKNQAELGLTLMNEEMKDVTVQATRATPRNSGAPSRNRVDSADSLAIYGQNRFEVTDRLAITAGLRMETYEQRRNDLRNAGPADKFSNTEFMPGLGATYQLIPEVQLYGSVYRAFSPPLVGSVIGSGDTPTEAEKSVNIELGARGSANSFTYEVTAFQMDFSNQVDPGISGIKAPNEGSALVQGIEAALGYDFRNGFTIDTNVTWVPTAKYREDRGSGGAEKGNRFENSPEITANLAFGYGNDTVQSALLINYTGEFFSNAANDKELTVTETGNWGGKVAAHTTADLTANFNVNKQLNVFGAVKNLTDERYIAGLRQGIYAGPSRSFELGARYKF
ncbi:TonB-dependent receptor family protein [Thiomicrospira cyclica]|uniref:TonB-dependent receptor n=1 Tax=Thiomicrospira cyclica (strain DSM 14477 / JCM 11371 / ALM1) TaxID=717773 RepID=F6DBI0_THICA|nr:TonB-dependent receptor [Thiomicrospira cyclica]AEG32382.1 TonB-dependent receptor [Thiomicrospira cyclica ALM1]